VACNIALSPSKLGLKPHQLQLILDAVNQQKSVKHAWLFGSRALGTHKDSSDVDIALEGAEISIKVLADLLEALEQSSLPYKVDLVVKNKIVSQELLNHINEYGLQLK
jgi:predicted nucleotidyltransferase